MRTVSAVVFASVFVLAACAETEDYGSCPFDPCLYEQCSAEAGALAEGTSIRFSCAVQHPQCDAGWCLIFEGSGSFCTQECDHDLGADACPGDAECKEYLGASDGRPAVYYCVPPESSRPQPVDPGVCSTI